MAHCLLSTDVMFQTMMLTWISLVHPLKISGLEVWQCNDCLWTVHRLHQSSLFSLPPKRPKDQHSELDCIKQSFASLDLLTLSPVSAVSRPISSSDRMHLHKACSLCGQCAFIHNKSGPLLVTVFSHALQADQKDSLIIKSGFCHWATYIIYIYINI